MIKKYEWIQKYVNLCTFKYYFKFMSRTKFQKLSILHIILFLSSCATHHVQYDKSVIDWNESQKELDSKVSHTFYLIGDGGKASKSSINSNYYSLKNDLNKASKQNTVLFLGDNIYEKGMPRKNDPDRKSAEEILDAQLSLVDNFKGKTIFIPGNHDYYNEGTLGLKREADYITKKLDDKDAFLPKNGCPIKKVAISDNIVLVIVDSQWFLEDWDKSPTMNSECDIKTREGFFDEFEGILKKNEQKTILISLHHPLFSNGPHGGQFSIKQQLFPINDKIPLPIFGSFVNLLRKTSGASPQDLQNPIYLNFKKRIVTIAQKSKKAIFISGHENSLQYIERENKPQIISGAGSKSSAARAVNGGLFSYGGIGYAKVEVLENGASWVYFYTEENNKQKLLFKKEIFQKMPPPVKYNYPDFFSKTVKTSIYSKEETTKGKLFNAFWGEHYRKYYSTKVEVPTVLLDTLFGGLTPIRTGGGHQSRSIRLVDKDGKEYVMRALKKAPHNTSKK
jgi:predicted phosphohydrolase